MILITINGEQRSFGKALTISELLAELSLNSRATAVEINHQIQPRDAHDNTIIKSGDVLEIVTLVGGG